MSQAARGVSKIFLLTVFKTPEITWLPAGKCLCCVCVCKKWLDGPVLSVGQKPVVMYTCQPSAYPSDIHSSGNIKLVTWPPDLYLPYVIQNVRAWKYVPFYTADEYPKVGVFLLLSGLIYVIFYYLVAMFWDGSTFVGQGWDRSENPPPPRQFVHSRMLTLFILPLSFVATALCKSSNWSSTKSEGAYESGGRQAGWHTD